MFNLEKSHHLIKQNDLINQCPYCDLMINIIKWEVDKMHNYLHTNCDCGMDITIKIEEGNALHTGILEKLLLSSEAKEEIFHI